MIHAYELGLLSEDDSAAFEIHLLECPACNQKFLELSETTLTLRSDPEIHSAMAALATENAQKDKVTAQPSPARPFYRQPIPVRWLATVAAVIALLVLKPWNIRFESDDPVHALENRVAIMPFQSLAPTTDTSRIADIVTNLLISDLSESHYLQVIPGYNVLNSSEYLRLKDASIDSTNGERAALERLGARWTLTGQIITLEPQITIAAQLTDLSGGHIVASLKETGEVGDDIFKLVDKLAARIRQKLLPPHALQDEFDPKLADVTTRSAEAYRWYLEGVELYGRKHFIEAVACYRKTVQYDSTFAIGWYCLAFHDVPHALENAVRFSGRASHREQLYINSLVAQTAGDDTKAELLLQELVDHYPNEKIAWMELASIARQQQRYTEAVYDLQQSLKADPLYIDAINLLAYVYNDLGEFEQALTTIDESIAIEPNEPNPYDSKGELLALNGHLDEAVQNYELALSRQPDFFGYETTLKLGQLYIYQGNYDKARDTIQTAALKGNAGVRSTARVALSFIPLYQGKLSQAKSILNDAFAADRLEQAARINPGATLYKYILRGQIELAQNDTLAALATLREGNLLLKQADQNYQNYYSACFAYGLARAGAETEAQKIVSELRARLTTSSDRTGAIQRAEGFVAFAHGQYDKALAELKQVADPDFETLYLIGRANLQLGQPQAAADRLKQALNNFSDIRRLRNSISAVEAYYYLALAEEQSGNKELAADQYLKFLDTWIDAEPSLTLIPEARERLSRLRGNM